MVGIALMLWWIFALLGGVALKRFAPGLFNHVITCADGADQNGNRIGPSCMEREMSRQTAESVPAFIFVLGLSGLLAAGLGIGIYRKRNEEAPRTGDA